LRSHERNEGGEREGVREEEEKSEDGKRD
jgi:hypothetical protein